MTDKEKYTLMMQRYWEAGTTPEEEKILAGYVARSESPEFDEIRGVLGYLSIGRKEKARHIQSVRRFSLVAALGCIIVIIAVSLRLGNINPHNELCARYSFGEKIEDQELIMSSVKSSLADFFSSASQEGNDINNRSEQ